MNDKIRITIGGGTIDKNCIRVPMETTDFNRLSVSDRKYLSQLIQNFIKDYGYRPMIFKSIPICN